MAKETYCNLCGQKFNFWDTQEEFNIHTYCGYGSKYDGRMLQLDICCDCMDTIIDQCVINPIAPNEHDVITEVINENRVPKN